MKFLTTVDWAHRNLALMPAVPAQGAGEGERAIGDSDLYLLQLPPCGGSGPPSPGCQET